MNEVPCVDTQLALGSDMESNEVDPRLALKLGAWPSPKRLCYPRGGYLVVQEFETSEGEKLADVGAVGQLFVDESDLKSPGLASLGLGSGAPHPRDPESHPLGCGDFAMSHVSGVGR